MRLTTIRFCRVSAATFAACAVLVGPGALPAAADHLVCRKVVADKVTGEGRNAAEASRVKCAKGEMLTGGVCYPETRPEPDGSCQTSAMGIIQQIVDHPQTTEESFFSCLQTGGTSCPVEARTRAMAICCKIESGDAPVEEKK